METLLAVVAVAVGLTGISAALGSHLRVLGRLQEEERRLRLAAMRLEQAAVEAQQFGAAAARAGVCEPPDAAYRWRLAFEPQRLVLNDASFDVAVVHLTVTRGDAERAATRLTALWPAEWVTE